MLLGALLEVQDHNKVKFSLAVKGLRYFYFDGYSIECIIHASYLYEKNGSLIIYILMKYFFIIWLQMVTNLDVIKVIPYLYPFLNEGLD